MIFSWDLRKLRLIYFSYRSILSTYFMKLLHFIILLLSLYASYNTIFLYTCLIIVNSLRTLLLFSGTLNSFSLFLIIFFLLFFFTPTCPRCSSRQTLILLFFTFFVASSISHYYLLHLSLPYF